MDADAHELEKIAEQVRGNIFDRIVSILDQARSNVVRTVNSQMVLAYWLIGREIVQELQGGDERAEYGTHLLEELTTRLTERYGSGFSAPNLKNFRQFYLIYQSRSPRIGYPAGSQSPTGFHPNLTWSHYRALMRVENPHARDFYETEAVRCGWSKRELERQISTLFYERILASRDKAGMLEEAVAQSAMLKPVDVLKDPYILEFLNLPDSTRLHESDIEASLIANLQAFLLELGKGFSFVAQQKLIRMGHKDFYVDLVFYNYLIKCFVLIDLKVGELTHQDIGQMDGYVRLYEEQFKVAGDNPTIGLILCSDKDDAVVHYSVLKESQQLFASRYRLILPDEEELRQELERERRLIEEKVSRKDE